jgi:hypothetical protein
MIRDRRRLRPPPIAAVTMNLRVKLGREPTDFEVAGILAMSITKLRKVRS